MNSVVKARVDAWVQQDAANVNKGQATRLHVAATASAIRRAFLRFPIPFEIGAEITNAKLRLRLAGTGWAGGPHTITIERVNQSWKETGPGGVTYNNQPTVTGGTFTLGVTGGTDKQMIEIDITTLMSNVSAGQAYYGLRITVNTTGTKLFYSSEALDVDLQPELDVTWAVIPDAPVDLHPSAGLAFSLAKPIFAWAAENQVQYKLQVDDTNVFTTPDLDTGFVASTATQHDFGPGGYSFPLDVTRYWRIQFINADGKTSDWSDPATVIRRTKATLTITSPSGSTVDDTSPVITHTHTVTTQEAVRYIVEESQTIAGKQVWVPRYDSGMIVTTALSFTLPENGNMNPEANKNEPLLRLKSSDYRLTLRAWDTFERATTPGDFQYVETQKTFQYVINGTPSVPTNVQVIANTTPGPETTLEFQRSVRPDYFAFLVDGKYIDTRVLPTDIEISGGSTTYRYKFWRLKPNVQSSIAVEAVIVSAGKYINSNPVAVNTTPVIRNKWLSAPDYGLRVCLLGDEDPEFSVGENAALLYPEGRRGPVKVSSTIRGYEGSVAGGLSDYLTLTAAQQRDTFEQILAVMNVTELRLHWQDRNIPIIITNIEGPQPYKRMSWYNVAFDFFQIGEYTFTPAA
jgi:hypothetical protein